MSDLVVGACCLALSSAILFVVGRHWGQSLPKAKATALGMAVVGALLSYVLLLSDSLLLVAFFPFSNLIILDNGIPCFTSLVAGIAWSLIPRQAATKPAALTESQLSTPVATPPLAAVEVGERSSPMTPGLRLRRLTIVVILQVMGAIAVVRPLWGQPPHCQNRWEGGLCIQTTDSTCTAACAASLLRAYGIESSEQEMADLCLTRGRGTLWQGLYRGLKLKTAGTPWDVAIVQGPFDNLRSLEDRPAILAAGVPRNATLAPIYTERYGWAPGEWHSVLFYKFRGNGLVAMGDPTPGIGLENWTEDDLRLLWFGRGMRLVPRSQPVRSPVRLEPEPLPNPG